MERSQSALIQLKSGSLYRRTVCTNQLPTVLKVTDGLKVSFVDETNVVASNYDVVPELETSDVESSHSTVDRYDVDWIATLSVGEEVAPTQHRSISFSHARHTIQFSPEAHSSDFLTSHSPVSSAVYQYHVQASPTVARSSPSDHGISPAFNPSFTNLNEAYLLRHYSETIGPCVSTSSTVRPEIATNPTYESWT
jgi:hypothetical protein